MNRSAKFLVILDSAAGRALLFDGDQRWLGEVMEEDGYIVDRLLLDAKSCSLPHPQMLVAALASVPTCASLSAARCFELG